MKQDFKDSLMMICKGDVIQYSQLLKTSAEDFLIKYKSFINSIE